MRKKKRNMMAGDWKMLLSGSILELLRFTGEPPNYSDDARTNALRRARSSLKRKINANAGQWYNENTQRMYLPLFLTLTFAENLQDIPTANRLFKDFILRFNYHFFGSKKAILKYVTVIEFQERGAVHYHCVLFNVPFIPNLSSRFAEVWQHGFIMINPIDDVKNVGAYVTKYMTKDIEDIRLRGKKTYFTSRGLLKTIVSRDDIKIAEFVSLLPVDSLISEYDGEFFHYQRHSVYNSVLRMVNTSRSIVSVDTVEVPRNIQLGLF